MTSAMKDDWRPMSSAPSNAAEIRVRMADGSVIERAHWACDTSGEAQPPFRGLFKPVTGDDGRVLYYADIGEPVAWMPIENRA